MYFYYYPGAKRDPAGGSATWGSDQWKYKISNPFEIWEWRNFCFACEQRGRFWPCCGPGQLVEVRDKTIADNLMYNDNTQNKPYHRFDTQLDELANQNSMKVPKVVQPTYTKTLW